MGILNSSVAIDNTSVRPGAILEAEHLRKLFPLRQLNPFAASQAVYAVEDTSLALYPGRATALVGESGSGKTTIARMLARIYDPTSGAIRFRGGRPELVDAAPGADVDVAIGVADFSALVMGSVRLRSLVAYGRAVLSKPTWLRRLDAAFDTDPPHCLTRF